MGRAYYNEIDAYAAQWLRNLIAAGHIAPGDVDERSIVDVRPDDLKGYTQCHFFAGIGGWSYAARLAGWPDDRELWTGSCPCQPYSVAGQGKGQDDDRDLWPAFFDLIRAESPTVVMGEQVAAAVGKHWLDRVHSDMEGIGYSIGAAVVPACAVGAPHKRDRLWFVADCDSSQPRSLPGDAREMCGLPQEQCEPELGSAVLDGGRTLRGNDVADSERSRQPEQPQRDSETDAGERSAPRRLDALGFGVRGSEALGNAGSAGLALGSRSADERSALRGEGPTLAAAGHRTPWGASHWLAGADGKARRVEPGIRLLAHGVPARVGKLRAYGNAIVPQVAAEVIGAYLDAERLAA